MKAIDPRQLERISKELNSSVEDELSNLNLFFRVFYRCKSELSLTKKLSKKNENGTDKYGEYKKIQDIIGVRINLYFADDIDIAYNLFKKRFEFIDETIDKNMETEFKPTRINLIFRIPKKNKKEFRDLIPDTRVDDTFELQLRTVLSEGWHEVDHDLRYKCDEDWKNHSDLSRMFNGILASLETNEWSILQLFNDLAYRHYRNLNTEAMLRTKFRMRLEDKKIDPKLVSVIDKTGLHKKIFKIDRLEFLQKLKEANLIVPMNIDNLIFILNAFYMNDAEILSMTPEILWKELKLAYSPV